MGINSSTRESSKGGEVSEKCYDRCRCKRKRNDRVRKPEEVQRFERIVMPHLGAGYNLARWLTHNDHDAEDVVQEAYLRALRAFDRYRGGDPRSWLLTIVRNTCYTWLRQNRRSELAPGGDLADDTWAETAADPAGEPEAQFIRNADRQLLREALEALPAEFREAFVLRELEGCSYKEIADIVDVPLGTVMSRLARARKQLQQFLVERMKERA
jgi:RNA polymerase sigma-70 factor (ECF subfamily)